MCIQNILENLHYYYYIIHVVIFITIPSIAVNIIIFGLQYFSLNCL